MYVQELLFIRNDNLLKFVIENAFYLHIFLDLEKEIINK